jgi:phosphatidylethanolamine/phosphatidyl-N-methylethanolamine N-methyltransferase
MKSMSHTEFRRRPALLQRVQGRIVGIGRIEESAVLDAYRRWAPVYDHTFGLVAREGRRHAVEVINTRGPRRQVGVSTGLSLRLRGAPRDVGRPIADAGEGPRTRRTQASRRDGSA